MNNSMTICVASGKGGTGKTTISLALSSYLAQHNFPVSILDCDVEEPNVNLFLNANITERDTVYVPVPEINEDRCTGCGNCEEICAFNALVLIKGEPFLFQDMCHSCGGCTLACSLKAIIEIPKEIGIIKEGYANSLHYLGGELKIGEALSPPLIKAVKGHINTTDINIIDSPPGTSCPAIEAITDSDYVILVTEPTPFGLNDLSLAVGMVREIGIPFGVVINRYGIGNDGVDKYCDSEKIDVIARFPESREIAERYSKGDFIEYIIQTFPEDILSIINHAGIRIISNGVAS